MKIAILATGGTFDKEYNELTGALYFRKTHIDEMLRLGRCQLDLRVEVVMMKDSLQMTDSDREVLLEACRRAPEKHIVITHGTDTMEDTARFLDKHRLDKTIILTGAMVPYTFGSSDGMFNLGSALSFAQVLPQGVFVAMNGRCFDPQNVRKDRKIGVFVEKEEK
jgi:L-asparaginase